MSACTCNPPHPRSDHRNGVGRCLRAGCSCLYGPPPARHTALPRPAEHGIGHVDADGLVQDFKRLHNIYAPAVQTMTIPDWHPTVSANGSHGHWAVHQKRLRDDQTTAWAYAERNGWEFVAGKVALTIVLVHPRTYRVDADNLAAKCKGLIDGLKQRRGRGFFTDDSTEWLDLHVKAEVRKGVKATEVTLASMALGEVQQPLPTYNGGTQKGPRRSQRRGPYHQEVLAP